MMAEDEAIDHIANRIRNDILFNEMYPLEGKVDWLIKVVIQLYGLSVHRRLVADLDSLSATLSSIPTVRLAEIKVAIPVLNAAITRFLGAMAETTNPVQVYESYLAGVRTELGHLNLGMLLREEDVLPPRPIEPPP